MPCRLVTTRHIPIPRGTLLLLKVSISRSYGRAAPLRDLPQKLRSQT